MSYLYENYGGQIILNGLTVQENYDFMCRHIALKPYISIKSYGNSIQLNLERNKMCIRDRVYAQNMGVDIRRFRLALVLLSSILSACVTAFAGPVSFVGIAVPHLAKSLFKTAKPILMIPGCFLGGAVFCLFCDLIARTAFAPTEVSISSVTAVFGAPVVIYMMVRGRKNIQ